MRSFPSWLLCLAVTAQMVIVSYQWLDRPITLWVHNYVHLPHHAIVVAVTDLLDPLIPGAIIAVVAIGLWALAGRTLSRLQATTVICSLSVLVAEATKNQLKYVFGRTWPDTWIDSNASYIHNGVYGFNWLQDGSAYRSFPSGHMAVTCAIISVLWIWYPRLRFLYIFAALAVAIGLVGANYHFLSDVIAGAFVGLSSGWMAVAIWRARISE